MSKVINAGLIGFGLSGKVFHAPFLHHHRGFLLKKVVERHREESKTIYPYVEVVRDYKDLLRDPAIDVVIVGTPNIWHYPMAKDAILSGKHVIIEKPFTPKTHEADELIQLARLKNVKLFVYQNRRLDADFLTIKKIIASGTLGEIVSYEAHFDRYRPDIKPGAWREEPQPGSGILYDLGSHLIDQALHLFGLPEGVKAEIIAEREGSRVDDYFDLRLLYGKFEVTLKAGMLVEDEGPRFIIRGKEGSFVKYGIDPQEEKLKKGMPPDEDLGIEKPDYWGVLKTYHGDVTDQECLESEHGNYMGFYDNVCDVLVNDGEMLIKPEEARQVIRVIELAFDSNGKKATIRFDP